MEKKKELLTVHHETFGVGYFILSPNINFRYADLRDGFDRYAKDMEGELERIDNQWVSTSNRLHWYFWFL